MRYLRGMQGLGDNIYQRAAVRELGPVLLETPWPQLYADLPDVQCLRVATRLRTQAKNAARGDLQWARPVPRMPRREQLGYRGQHVTMLQGILESVGLGGLQSVTFDLPRFNRIGIFNPAPYVVVRPCTVREEWRADSRNPDPAYVAQAAADMQRAGYRVIVVADIKEGVEWLDGPLPPHDVAYLHGELRLEELLMLVSGAEGVIGGVGWLLPAAIAYRVPMLLIYGGWGHVNGPQVVLDDRLDTTRLVHAMPDNFCMCNDKTHACDRTITHFTRRLHGFQALVASLRRRSPDMVP